MKLRVFTLISSLLLASVVNGAGPDVILGVLDRPIQYERADDVIGVSIGTTSCNAGNQILPWKALPDAEHPVITWNLYRELDGRMEQIGQAWTKHGYFALSGDACSFGCIPAPDGTALGVGCSDPYQTELNFEPRVLWKRSAINPFTGTFDGRQVEQAIRVYVDNNPDEMAHAVWVKESDLGLPGARYYFEGHYISSADSIAGNGGNNVSYLQVDTRKSNGTWVFSEVGNTVRSRPAISAWTSAHHVNASGAPHDGDITVSYLVKELEDSQYLYEYSVYNMNSERGVRSFHIPVGGNVEEEGFSFVFSHGEGFSNEPWVIQKTDGAVTWSTKKYSDNPSANAIRWGNTFNFWFVSNNPPQMRTAKLNRFKPGAGPETVEVNIQAPKN